MIKGILLSSGTGGMDVGFEAAGVNVVLANEIDRTAAKIYATNHLTT